MLFKYLSEREAERDGWFGIRKTMKSHESKIKNLTGIITAHETCERLKPVMDAYGKIWFKGKKEKRNRIAR